MENSKVEELLNELYSMIQDARSVPLSQEKCIIEREHALDLMEEIMGKWPTEVRDAQSILAARTELISQARREGEGIIRGAKEQADKLVTEEALYQESKRRCEEVVQQTKAEMTRIQAAAYQYLTESLKETEKAISDSLATVAGTREKFQALVGSKQDSKE